MEGWVGIPTDGMNGSLFKVKALVWGHMDNVISLRINYTRYSWFCITHYVGLGLKSLN